MARERLTRSFKRSFWRSLWCCMCVCLVREEIWNEIRGSDLEVSSATIAVVLGAVVYSGDDPWPICHHVVDVPDAACRIDCGRCVSDPLDIYWGSVRRVGQYDVIPHLLAEQSNCGRDFGANHFVCRGDIVHRAVEVQF